MRHGNSYLYRMTILICEDMILCVTWHSLYMGHGNYYLYDMTITIWQFLYAQYYILNFAIVERMTKAASCSSYGNDNNDELQRATTAASYIDNNDEDGGRQRRR